MIHIYTYTHPFLCKCSDQAFCTSRYMYTYICMHIYIHIYIYTYLCIYICIYQPSLTEIRETVMSFNLFIRDLGYVIAIFSCQKAQISNNMTTFGHPFLLSPLILRNCHNSRKYLMQVRCSVGNTLQ